MWQSTTASYCQFMGTADDQVKKFKGGAICKISRPWETVEDKWPDKINNNKKSASKNNDEILF